MGLLEAFERLLGTSRREERVDFREILCERWDDACLKKFRTRAQGSDHRNVDGSERQDALGRLREGDRVRLLVSGGGHAGSRCNIFLVRADKVREMSMSECFGRLSDGVAADVLHWLNRDRIVTAARVHKLTGGTRKKPKLGCVLELRTYPSAENRPD